MSILAKPALRMLNGLLTFHYGALNSSCYYGDSAPGSELPASPSYADLAAGAQRRGQTTSGSVRSLLRAARFVPMVDVIAERVGLPEELVELHLYGESFSP